MRIRKVVVPLVVVLVLVLVAGTMYALAQCSQAAATAGQAQGGCGMMKASGGCGMQGMSCGMQGKASCAMGKGMGLHHSLTRALTSGQATIVATRHGLMLVVTDLSQQGDPNASVSVWGVGPKGGPVVQARRMGAGHFRVEGDTSGLTELAVRVNRAGTSEVVYFGLATLHAPAMTCKCGAGCKCASGDHSACKCGAGCMCGKSSSCQPTTAGRCSMMDSGACKTMGACKAP